MLENPNMVEKIFWFFVLCFAVWRTSSLFAWERGPLDIFARIRSFAEKRGNATNNKLKTYLWFSLYDGLTCVWCNSIWFSAIFSITISGSVIEWFFLMLAVSTGAIIIERCLHG